MDCKKERDQSTVEIEELLEESRELMKRCDESLGRGDRERGKQFLVKASRRISEAAELAEKGIRSTMRKFEEELGEI